MDGRRRRRRRFGAAAAAARETLLTVADDVEGAGHRFAGGVVASAHAALVPTRFGVEHVVAAGLLQGRVRREKSQRSGQHRKTNFCFLTWFF